MKCELVGFVYSKTFGGPRSAKNRLQISGEAVSIPDIEGHCAISDCFGDFQLPVSETFFDKVLTANQKIKITIEAL